MGDTLLLERYARVLDRIDAACASAGRSREGVRLIAVSKLHPAESLAQVAAAGQIDFGENYVQEALQKRQDLSADPATAAQCAGIRWHMIGHVQSRKAPLVGLSILCIPLIPASLRTLLNGVWRRAVRASQCCLK